MFKELIIIMTSVFAFNSCSSQSKFDIELMSFKEDVFHLLKGKEIYKEDVDPITSLPAYHTFEVDSFKFGEVEFSNTYEKRNDAPNKSSIYFLVDSQKSDSLRAVMLSIKRDNQGEMLYDYIEAKYGEPQVVAEEPEPQEDGSLVGSSAYLWKNFRKGYSMVLVKEYGASTAVYIESDSGEEEKIWLPVNVTRIIIVANDKTVGDSDYAVIDRVVETFKL